MRALSEVYKKARRQIPVKERTPEHLLLAMGAEMHPIFGTLMRSSPVSRSTNTFRLLVFMLQFMDLARVPLSDVRTVLGAWHVPASLRDSSTMKEVDLRQLADAFFGLQACVFAGRFKTNERNEQALAMLSIAMKLVADEGTTWSAFEERLGLKSAPAKKQKAADSS